MDTATKTFIKSFLISYLSLNQTFDSMQSELTRVL
jgi:hypothetical protein